MDETASGKDTIDMESLLINAIIGFWLVAFGAMALFPLLIDLRSEAAPHHAPTEDQVISIQPVASRHQLSSIDQRTEQPIAASPAEARGSSHPIHRHAA